jgi:hypothetical protein
MRYAMTTPTNPLIRTCNACGIEKPLSAFLQLGGVQGASYGNICAACRGAGKAEKTAFGITSEEGSTTPSGIGIRGKEKLFINAKIQQQIHSLKELYKKEDVKKQAVKDNKAERVHTKEKSERQHRESYITTPKTPVSQGKELSVRQQQTKKTIIARGVTEHQRVLGVKSKENAETITRIKKEERRKTTTDFNNLFHAIEPGKIEMQGELKRFFTWLGNSAPIVRTLNQGKNLTNTPINKQSSRHRG